MKQGNTISHLIVGILAVGLFFYFVFSFWESMTDTFTTAVVYEYTVSESVEGKGLIVREEELLPEVSGLLDVLRVEGEQVGVGQVVGRVYRDVGAMATQNQLEALSAEAETLEYAIGEERDLITVTKMDDTIVNVISSLRSSVALGNMNQLETLVSGVKGNVLRRDYIFGSPQVVKDIEDRYGQVVYEMTHSSQVASGSMNTVTTPVSGAYSILVDGLEYLDYSVAMAMNVEDLSRLLEMPLQQFENTAGKIIHGNTWCFVTAIPTEWAEGLQVGRGVTVRFSGDFAQEISMKVERMEDFQGMSMVVLSSSRYLEQTTLLRVQTVELVYRSDTGIRIPKESLRMEEYINGDTGEVVQRYGVYALSAGYAEFKTVELITESNDYYLVKPTHDGASGLKQGNVIIVHALGLYDGKLMEW